ncbi:tetratricopeptide repeat protein 36-like [Uloborus diversus]|uniref:tetratricopeptide repeat protein 36-like n=1 Tax=Uloborus diversus TaxID=327109 RepID=UPI002409F3E7|nr:tetratricopeptide repeat protein 36-like [Uloborus diversus]
MSSKEDLAILNSVFNPLSPLGEGIFDHVAPEELKDEDDSSASVSEAKRLELEAVRSAESGDVTSAIRIFGEAIDLAPNRPSGYNNRAQAYRLKGEIFAALKDLDTAIKLGSGKGRSTCLAYCQRALIYRFQGKTEMALEDFKKAASLGSSFARSQMVQMNPYAALCNQMLSKVMEQYQKGMS